MEVSKGDYKKREKKRLDHVKYIGLWYVECLSVIFFEFILLLCKICKIKIYYLHKDPD